MMPRQNTLRNVQQSSSPRQDKRDIQALIDEGRRVEENLRNNRLNSIRPLTPQSSFSPPTRENGSRNHAPLGLRGSNSKPVPLRPPKPLKNEKKNKPLGAPSNEKNQMIVTPRSQKKGKSILKKMNPYYLTLKYPADHLGVKIPDTDYSYSCAFTIVSRYTMTVGSNGVGGVICGWGGGAENQNWCNLIPEPNGCPINGVTTDCAFGLTTNSSGVHSGNHVAGASIPFTLSSWTSALSSPAALFTSVRVVSGGIAAWSLSSDMNRSGEWVGFSLPRTFLPNSSPLSTFDVNYAKNLPGTSIIPASSSNGVEATYMPCDPQCMDYIDTDLTTLPGVTNDFWVASPGVFGFFYSGAEVGSSISFTIVMNYEGIPSTSSLYFASPTPSLSDPIQLSEAQTMRQQEELTGANVDSYQAMDPTADSHSALSHPFTRAFKTVEGGMAVIPMYLKCKKKKVGSTGDTPDSEEGDSSSMFDKLFNMIVPLLEKVGPELLAAL